MPPPELPTDAPILYVPHPGKVGVFPLLWDKLDRPVFDGGDGRLCQFLGIDIPLRCQPWLDHGPRSIPSGHFKGMRLNLLQQIKRLELLNNQFARVEPV